MPFGNSIRRLYFQNERVPWGRNKLYIFLSSFFICRSSHQEILNKQKQDYARYAENASNYSTDPADTEGKSYKAAEKIEYKQHDKAQKSVQQQLECPLYRRGKDFYDELYEQYGDDNGQYGM